MDGAKPGKLGYLVAILAVAKATNFMRDAAKSRKHLPHINRDLRLNRGSCADWPVEDRLCQAVMLPAR
jgi:hypothetical protein